MTAMFLPGLTGTVIFGSFTSSTVEEFFSDSGTIVFLCSVPVLEFDNETDAFGFPYGAHSEDILNVEDAQPAYFHVMPQHAGAFSVEEPVTPATDENNVVGDQTMPSFDKFERALALSHARPPHYHDAYSEDIYKDTMKAGFRRELVVEKDNDFAHNLRGGKQ